MAKALARGDSYAKLRDEIARRFVGQSVSNIMRVVQTEGTYVSRQVQGEEMQRAGFDAYYIDSVEDKHTCDTCRAISKRSHEEPFRFEDAKPGENYPPLHPRCRCEVNPAVDDWADFIKGGDGRAKVAERFGASSPTVLGKKGRSVSGLPDPELVDGEWFDPDSPREVRRFIRKYATLIKDLEVEHVYILDANGRVWHAIGDGENVSYGGVELQGARVLHNHPTIDGERVSFGADDFQMLQEYPEAAALFAVNDTFFYSAKANASIQGVGYNEAYRNADLNLLVNGEEQQHLAMEWLDEHGYVDYRRQDIRDI